MFAPDIAITLGFCLGCITYLDSDDRFESASYGLPNFPNVSREGNGRSYVILTLGMSATLPAGECAGCGIVTRDRFGATYARRARVAIH